MIRHISSSVNSRREPLVARHILVHESTKVPLTHGPLMTLESNRIDVATSKNKWVKLRFRYMVISLPPFLSDTRMMNPLLGALHPLSSRLGEGLSAYK